MVVLLGAAAAQRDQGDGRQRLRELVQKARAGDVEAQTLLASRRRKIVRNPNNTPLNRPASPRRDQAVVEAALAGPAQTEGSETRIPTLRNFRDRGQSLAARPRSRAEAQAQQLEQQDEVTTFKPVTTTTTQAPPTERPAKPAVETRFEPVEEETNQVIEPLVEEQAQEPEPARIIPALFQPAQFGRDGVGFQPTQSITRTVLKPAAQPHRAIQRGLETGTRSEINAISPSPEEEKPRAPIVHTTRRYSYFDEGGNYVFGYEAEDGSFKEEVRGKDCIVHGKYGYIDPDGIRREFTYVSGNKCDPNNPEAQLGPDGEPIPLNDQFLRQTAEQSLSDAELAKLRLNRRRKPASPKHTENISEIPAKSRAVVPVRQGAVPDTQLTITRTQTKEQVDSQANRFPVPDFLQDSRRQGRPHAPRQPPAVEAQPIEETTVIEPEPKLPVTEPNASDGPRVVPSLFQPAQFGPGGVGVPSSQISGRPPVSFDFNREFGNVFSHFGNVGQPVPRPIPRPTTTTTPQPTPPTSKKPSSVPSLFRPAQLTDTLPKPPAVPHFDDNSFTLGQSAGANQLVFDASTGTFKTVTLQTKQFVPQQAPHPTIPRPTPPPPKPTTPKPPPATSTGRPLFIANHAPSGRSPLPSIPTTAAEFDRFFSQFPSLG